VDPGRAIATSLAAVFALALVVWLAVGRASGQLKRVAYRVALLLFAAALIEGAHRRGVFARSSPGFVLLIGAIVLLVVVGQLYSVRFCSRCGRMMRNFRLSQCPRCGAALPRHGFTQEPRKPPLDPTDPLGSRRRGSR
jgi:hypothetical protein